MLVPLRDARAETCGAKAAVLGRLLRAGFPVPDGFIVPWDAELAPVDAASAERSGIAEISDAIKGIDRQNSFAVRSSAPGEDGTAASAAGMHTTTIGARDAAEIVRAVLQCRASLDGGHLRAYWHRIASTPPAPGVAVLVQPVIPAHSAGVMFTPMTTTAPLRIEAARGLGISVVSGDVTPDAHALEADGTILTTIGHQATRIDLDAEHGGTIRRALPEHEAAARVLDDATILGLGLLGHRIADTLGGPQDIEWAIVDDTIWVLQARPITATVPGGTTLAPSEHEGILRGTPGSRGTLSARARQVRGPDDFSRIARGEILVCAVTDPAWTPLLGIAGGVVTERGGALSHAAIVAREFGIPAVLGVDRALAMIPDGALIALDGDSGTVTFPDRDP